ncbi:MAG: hypothetical protein JST23_04600 [Bacteroidetes bacterium]|nr:hypothetical protein [Bacteroidota bacterium]
MKAPNLEQDFRLNCGSGGHELWSSEHNAEDKYSDNYRKRTKNFQPGLQMNSPA